MNNTFEKLRDILVELGIARETICESSVVGLYEDSGLDLSSLDKIRFIVMVEEQFQIEIDIANSALVSLRDYVNYIEGVSK